MGSGKTPEQKLDRITDWELAAINVLFAAEPKADWDVSAVRENMLAFVGALDAGRLNPALEDPGFMGKTERLVLALLRGERMEVFDPNIFAARKEIFAAAQVVYNQAVARGMWTLHPEIRQALQGRV
jgi:hypothetical protein